MSPPFSNLFSKKRTGDPGGPDWTTGYLEASFRGVPFFIQGAGYTTGRRNVKHVYPRQNIVDHEDMGQDDKTFSLDAYVLGDDYYNQRNRLEDALDLGGSGVLVHPYRGVLTVVVDSYSVNERTSKGRFADIKLNFSLQAIDSLTAGDDTKRRVLNAKQSLLGALLAGFNKAYDATQGALGELSDARETLQGVFGLLDAAKRTVSTVADFKRELENAQGGVIALSLNATSLVTSMQRICNWGTDPSSTPNAAKITSGNAAIQASEQWEMVNTPLTASGSPANQIANLMKHEATAALVGIAPFVPYATAQAALEAQADLFDLLDEQMETATDIIFEILRETKRALYNDFQSRIINLPQLVERELSEPTNALALSYDLYGTIDDAEETATSNDLIHPGFIPANVLLKLKVGGDE